MAPMAAMAPMARMARWRRWRDVGADGAMAAMAAMAAMERWRDGTDGGMAPMERWRDVLLQRVMRNILSQYKYHQFLIESCHNIKQIIIRCFYTDLYCHPFLQGAKFVYEAFPRAIF